MEPLSRDHIKWLENVNAALYDDDFRQSHFHAVFKGKVDSEYSEELDCTYANDQPCYGNICNMAEEIDEYGTGSSGLEELIVAIPKSVNDHRYTKYVLTLFDRAFVTKTVEEGLERGFTMNLDMPYAYLLGAMIALRKASQPWEMQVWNGFLLAGATEDEAFYLTDSFYVADGRIGNWDSFRPDHCVFDKKVTLNDFLRAKDSIEVDEAPAKKTAYAKYGSVWNMWPESGNGRPVGSSLAARFSAAQWARGIVVPAPEGFKIILDEIRKENSLCAA